MPNLTASVPHQLTRAEVKRRIQEQIGTLQQHAAMLVSDLQATWTGDEMSIRAHAMGQPISGRLLVEDRVVLLKVPGNRPV